jgi:hypothetical protein
VTTPERGALMLVRVIAVAFIAWTLVELALYFAVSYHEQTPIKILPCAVKSIPLLLGIIILIKSKALAAWISELLDN